jgi:enoyl-CoA hydratase/carnithine racemase
MTDTVLVERRERVMIGALIRPKVRNAVNRAVFLGVDVALENAERNPDVWGLIVAGSGEHSSCPGADLKGPANGEPLGFAKKRTPVRRGR